MEIFLFARWEFGLNWQRDSLVETERILESLLRDLAAVYQTESNIPRRSDSNWRESMKIEMTKSGASALLDRNWSNAGFEWVHDLQNPELQMREDERWKDQIRKNEIRKVVAKL